MNYFTIFLDSIRGGEMAKIALWTWVNSEYIVIIIWSQNLSLSLPILNLVVGWCLVCCLLVWFTLQFKHIEGGMPSHEIAHRGRRRNFILFCSYFYIHFCVVALYQILFLSFYVSLFHSFPKAVTVLYIRLVWYAERQQMCSCSSYSFSPY